MADYNTKLKSWGSLGQEFPNNYSYIEDEAPVDAWDNFFNHNLITDVKDHLVPLTNSRIESDYGASGSEPTSPESSHLYHNTEDETLNVWNTTTNNWDELLTSDLDGKDLTDGATTIWDTSAGEVPQSSLANSSVTVTAGNQLTGGGNVALGGSITVDVEDGVGSGLDADTVDGFQAGDLGSGASNDGVEILSKVTDFNFTNNLSVSHDGDGTVTVDGSHVHDSRYLLEAGDAMSGILDLSNNDLEDGTTTIWDASKGFVNQSALENSSVTVAGNNVTLGNSTSIAHGDLSDSPSSAHHTRYADSEAVTAVNNETSLNVDISGDSDTLDGQHATSFAQSSHQLEHNKGGSDELEVVDLDASAGSSGQGVVVQSDGSLSYSSVGKSGEQIQEDTVMWSEGYAPNFAGGN